MSNETLAATKAHLREAHAEYHKFLMALCELCLVALALAWLLGFGALSHLCTLDLQKQPDQVTEIKVTNKPVQTANLFTTNARRK